MTNLSINFQLEALPAMSENPKLHREMSTLLTVDVREKLDNYLRFRMPVDFLAELPKMLMNKPSLGCNYNISTMNAMVIHVGALAIDSIHEKRLSICIGTVANTAYMDVFQNLVVSLCTQGRYLLFNAIANQLRYPNSHTNYFSNTLLYLFRQAHSDEVREQIARILLERILAQKPHPWGLLFTLTELVRNKEYNLSKYEFARLPQVER
jgi:CCR4-NOT transcription complex subunit 1